MIDNQSAVNSSSNTETQTTILNKFIVQDIETKLQEIREYARHDLRKVYTLASEIITLAQSIKSENHEALGQLELSYYYCSSENNYTKSLQLCNAADKMLQGKFRKKYLPYLHLNKGRAYQFMGEQVKAQHEYLALIKLIEGKKTIENIERTWLASAYYNLFILFNKDGAEFTKEEFLQKAFDIYTDLNDSSGIAHCYNSFAVFYYKKNELNKSLDYLLQAKELALKSNSQTFLSIFSSNLGLVYAKLNEKSLSDKNFEEATRINNYLKSPYHFGHTYQQIGEAQAFLENYKTALAFYLRAEKIYLEIGVKSSLLTIYKYCSEAYEKLNDFANANKYQKKYANQLLDQFNDEKTFAIAKERSMFEFDKKEKEATVLKQQNKQIELYAKQLEISNNQLRQFAHIASHDLKEPLRMVSSYAKLLQRSIGDNLTEDQAVYLKFMLDGTVTMQKLVNDLLVLSKINYLSEKQTVHLDKVLKVVITNLHTAIEEKNAIVSYNHLPVVKAEETQMIQLFMNLISNAIKYNSSKQPEVIISCKKKKNMFQFSVSDNGIGVPEEYREKVFQMFQRLHSRNDYSGTGIGLAICKKIIDQLHGEIWIESSKLGGSTFKFTIPC